MHIAYYVLSNLERAYLDLNNFSGSIPSEVGLLQKAGKYKYRYS